MFTYIIRLSNTNELNVDTGIIMMSIIDKCWHIFLKLQSRPHTFHKHTLRIKPDV